MSGGTWEAPQNASRLPQGSTVMLKPEESWWGMCCRHFFPRTTACCERTASMLVKCVCGSRKDVRKPSAAGTVCFVVPEWDEREDEWLALNHRVGEGAWMWFCTVSSVFFTVSALTLYVWERQHCDEYTWAGLVDGCADAAGVGATGAGGVNVTDDAAAATLTVGGIVRGSATTCVDDYDCELTGRCNVTQAFCIYEDEAATRGSAGGPLLKPVSCFDDYDCVFRTDSDYGAISD